MTLSLAIRNLARNRRRSLATLLALAIGAAAVLLFGGYSADIRLGMLTSYVQSGGHLQIQHKDFLLYGNGNPTAYAIDGYARILDAIRSDKELKPLVRVVTPTLQFGGLAGNYDAGVSRTVIGVGYMADDIHRMRTWNEYAMRQVAPPYALRGAADDAAVVGIGLARVLQLCAPLEVKNCPRPEPTVAAAGSASLPADIATLALGEQASGRSNATRAGAKIEILASQPRGTPNVASLRVVAAEDQGFKDLDEITLILQLKQAQQLVYGRGEARASAIMLQLERSGSMAAVKTRLRALLKEVAPGQSLAILDFSELNPWYTQTLQLFDTIFGFIFVLIGAIVLFTVSNTMSTSVVERTTEIGTVRAIGLRQSGIRRLFLVEGVLLGCQGAMVGVLAALLLSAIVNAMHLDWLPPGSSTPLPLTVRVWGQTGMIAGTAVGLIALAAISAWWPAWRAAKLNIVEALRHA
jgi:putative ABC transport system permease protein